MIVVRGLIKFPMQVIYLPFFKLAHQTFYFCVKK